MGGEAVIGETEDRGTGVSFLLIVPHHSAADNAFRLMDRLREDYGYKITKEYVGDSQTVYAVEARP